MRFRKPSLGSSAVLLVASLIVPVAVLTWFGYRGVQESQRSAAVLDDERTNEAADLLRLAIMRDMRGAQTSVLGSSEWYDELGLDSEYDISLVQIVAGALRRYPYTEAFFVWPGTGTADEVVFFSRSDRPPSWMLSPSQEAVFPVLVGYRPTIAPTLLTRVAQDAAKNRRFSVSEINIGATLYQVVAHIRYQDRYREHVKAVFGFVVNLNWVQQHYFPDLTKQIARTAGTNLALSIVTDKGMTVVGDASGDSSIVAERTFPMTFFDPLLIAIDTPTDLSSQNWIARASLDERGAFFSAQQDTRLSGAVAALATTALVVGLFLTARAARRDADLGRLRSEFVATVTHELKTPLASIRALGDTLVSGRINSQETSREYAQLIVQQSKRLTRLVNNLLAYSRITDVTEVYAFEAISMEAVLDDTLHVFAAQLASPEFVLELDVPSDLPPVRADRTAIGLAFENVIENAIQYSDQTRRVRITARSTGAAVVVEVADGGIGIHEDELGLVTRKFFRGRGAASGGSGLGLTIVERIIGDHGGSLAIQSTVGAGTTVSITLPVFHGGRR